MKFKEELKKWRGERLQSQASKDLGVGVKTYQSWEQGIRVPHALTLEAIRARMSAAKK